MNQNDQKHGESIDALRAMADGEEIALPDELEAADGGREEPSSGIKALADGEGAERADDVDLADLPETDDALQARLKRTAALHHQTRRVHAKQFKQAMIPLLLVVGLMLFVLGAVTGYMVVNGTITKPVAKWAAIGAFPVGAVLLLSAWLFRLDLKAAES